MQLSSNPYLYLFVFLVSAILKLARPFSNLLGPFLNFVNSLNPWFATRMTVTKTAESVTSG